MGGYYPRQDVCDTLKTKVVTQPGATLEKLIALMEGQDFTETKVIIMAGFFCDFTYLSCMPDGLYWGLCKARLEMDYSSFVLKVTYWTRKIEREHDVRMVWTVPYVPDLARYNSHRTESRGMEEMNDREKAECYDGMKLLKNVMME